VPTLHDRPKSQSRRGFTLIELLVVIAVILVIAGLLLPAVTGAYRRSRIAQMKMTFHTISQALEAYKQDFRDYPRNPFATSDFYPPTTVSPSWTAQYYRPLQPRIDPTLAMALLGPGPAAAFPPGSAKGAQPYLNGDIDGADGPGFRTNFSLYQTVNFVSYAATGSPTGGPVLTITTGSAPGQPLVDPQGNILTIPPGNVSALPIAFSVVSLGGPGSPDVHVPIVGLLGGTTIYLLYPLQDPNPNKDYAGATVGLLTPTGKVWPSYLQENQFKVAYVPMADVSPASLLPGTQTSTITVPVLLDIFGGPILYFPAYNSYTNRLPRNTTNVNSTTPTWPMAQGKLPNLVVPPGTGNIPGMVVGPLFGSPSTTQNLVQPTNTMAPSYYYNTPVDTTNDTIPSVFWSGPLDCWGVRGTVPPNVITLPPSLPTPLTEIADPYTPMSTGQVAAILYKLGDQNIDNCIDSYLDGASPQVMHQETFALDLPYFMISAGPDGKFTDLYPGLNEPNNTNGPPGPGISNNWQAIINKSDDVYSFDP